MHSTEDVCTRADKLSSEFHTLGSAMLKRNKQMKEHGFSGNLKGACELGNRGFKGGDI